jgi:hypothetical protein
MAKTSAPNGLLAPGEAAIPQADARRLLISAVAGLGREPESSFLELRFRAGPGAPMRQAFYPCRDVATVSARAAVLAADHDVYINTAPLTQRFGGASAIARKWALAVDLDRDDALERIAAFSPWPSIVVTTGTGGHAHAYWILNRALSPEHAVRATRRLAHTLGADPRATDAARVLRVPGTMNHKHAPPSPVICTRLELDSYHAREIVGELPDPPERDPRPASTTPTPRPTDVSDVLRTIAASEYVALLTGHQVGRDGKIACPLPGHEERTPSFHAYTTPEQGWFCFGCGRGGTIIDFGAALYAIEPRGQGFHEIRRRLAADLLAHHEVAA